MPTPTALCRFLPFMGLLSVLLSCNQPTPPGTETGQASMPSVTEVPPTTTKAIDVPFQELICRLFGAKIDSATATCVWQPNTSDSKCFEQGNSNKPLYTKYHSMLEFTVGKDRLQWLLLATYKKDEAGDFESCHACAPMGSIVQLKYENAAQKFELDTLFKCLGKMGSWGEMPDSINLLQLGSKDFALLVTTEYSGQGFAETTRSIYYEGRNILTFSSHEDNAGAAETEVESFENNTMLSVDIHQRQITLKTTGTAFEGEKKRKIDKVVKYRLVSGKFLKM